MSELRFQQLQKSKTLDDFYRRLLRAVQLLDSRVNILSLANDILHWHREFTHTIDTPKTAWLSVGRTTTLLH